VALPTLPFPLLSCVWHAARPHLENDDELWIDALLSRMYSFVSVALDSVVDRKSSATRPRLAGFGHSSHETLQTAISRDGLVISKFTTTYGTMVLCTSHRLRGFLDAPKNGPAENSPRSLRTGFGALFPKLISASCHMVPTHLSDWLCLEIGGVLRTSGISQTQRTAAMQAACKIVETRRRARGCRQDKLMFKCPPP